ncbi:MAG: lytic transglycosylase domain-containing protein [Varibaculum sp.]|nr:lytic transglycosylase domain-containing protein [Varibaculum sp.]
MARKHRLRRALLATILLPPVLLLAFVAVPNAIAGCAAGAHIDIGYVLGFDEATVPAQYLPTLQRAGQVCPEVTPALLAAQIHSESGWDEHAESSAGAQGLAQFMPQVWAEGWGLDGDGDGLADIWNPADAIWSQANLMCDNVKWVRTQVDAGTIALGEYSEVDMALACYNAGRGQVQKAAGFPAWIPETVGYVETVHRLVDDYGGQFEELARSENPEAEAEAAAQRARSTIQPKWYRPSTWRSIVILRNKAELLCRR